MSQVDDLVWRAMIAIPTRFGPRGVAVIAMVLWIGGGVILPYALHPTITCARSRAPCHARS